MDRFAAAAEALLAERTFEEISIQDIVRRAGRPIGSFYARFGGKEALLPVLYRRYHEDLETRYERAFRRAATEGAGFDESIRMIVDFFVDGLSGRRGLLRAITLFARRCPEALPEDLLPQRRRIHGLPIAMLERHRARITRPDPDAAIRFGLYMVITVARERVLFGDLPLARVTPIGRDALRAELAGALRSYLTCEVHSS